MKGTLAKSMLAIGMLSPLMLRANVIVNAEAPVYFGNQSGLLNGGVEHNGAAFRLGFFF